MTSTEKDTAMKRHYKITSLPGDGVGPEIMAVALEILEVLASKHGFEVDVVEHPVGGAAIDSCGVPLPDPTVASALESDAVLLGAVGGPKWDSCPPHIRPEAGLLSLRKQLELFCNLRPVKTFEALTAACPIKSVTAERPIDMMIVRELTGGIYFGDRGSEVMEDGVEKAWDVEAYSAPEVRRIADIALDLAATRTGRLTSVDKANVLNSSRLWRKTVEEQHQAISGKHEDKGQQVTLTHQYVDNAAMQLIINPHQFDVVLTNNIFGDILSDEASTLVGSIGLMPSASLGTRSL